MTRWFDSNYHYLVPEIGPETVFTLFSDRIVRESEEGWAAGFVTGPVIVGSVTFLALSKASAASPDGFRPLSRLSDLLPVYIALLSRLADAGVQRVQLDEPALGLDLIRGTVPSLSELVEGGQVAGGLAAKTVVGGVIDGHNIWRGELEVALTTLLSLLALSPRTAVSTSTSLFHLPHDVDDESLLSDELNSWLAFADQEVAQVVTLTRGLDDGYEAVQDELNAASAALSARLSAAGVSDGAVRACAAEYRDLMRGEIARVV